MTLDITNLLLGSAFGIFIALLAWGDQIRKPRKEIMELHGIRQQLESDYTFRYLFSIWLCIILYIFGIISIYTNELTFQLFNIITEFNIFLLFIVIIMIAVLIHNFFRTHEGEKLFVNEIYSTDDRIEVKD